MAVSGHLKWLATGGSDGKLILRATGAIVSKKFGVSKLVYFSVYLVPIT